MTKYRSGTNPHDEIPERHQVFAVITPEVPIEEGDMAISYEGGLPRCGGSKMDRTREVEKISTVGPRTANEVLSLSGNLRAAFSPHAEKAPEQAEEAAEETKEAPEPTEDDSKDK